MLDFSVACAIALKTALLLTIAGAAARALAKKSSAFRHALWTLTLLLSVLMPVAVLTLPSLAVIPTSWSPPELVGSAEPSIHAVWSRDFWSTGSIVWLAGVLILLLRGLVGHFGLIRWRLNARPVRSSAWLATLHQVSAEWRIRPSLRVLESPSVVNPCTWGFIRPVLLLPMDGDTWTGAERRHALTHELAHIRRHDYLSATLAHLACAIHWYNALVWLAAQQSRKLQEQACDDMVLRSGAMPSDYASFLVRAAESAQGESNALAAAMGVARHSELRERVDSILDPTRPRAPLSRASVFATSIPAACLALLLAASIPGSPAHTFDVREGEITPLPALPALPRPPETPPAPPPLPPQEPVPPVEAVPATPPDLPNPTNEGIRA